MIKKHVGRMFLLYPTIVKSKCADGTQINERKHIWDFYFITDAMPECAYYPYCKLNPIMNDEPSYQKSLFILVINIKGIALYVKVYVYERIPPML